MIRHHPPADMLLQHAAGALSWSFSLSVAAHLHMCPQCRQHVRHLNHIGGELLEVAPTEAPSPQTFARVMKKINQPTRLFAEQPAAANEMESSTTDPTDRRPPTSSTRGHVPDDLPGIIRKLVPPDRSLRWSRISTSSQVAVLSSRQQGDQISLYRIECGGKIAEHDHKGIEATLVLDGHYSDEEGVYETGDFAVKEPGEIHQPTATQDRPCLLLAVVGAPTAPLGFISGLREAFATR